MKDEYAYSELQCEEYEKGRKQKALKTAWKMRGEGFEQDKVAKLTGITIDKLEQWSDL